MTKISIFTTMTDPEERMDPWKEALNCYEDFADEVIITGQDWPDEFKWDHIGKTFYEGFLKSTGDWVIRMDLDYFFHEKSLKSIRKILENYKDYPSVAFPQYQIFTPERYQVKTNLCIAYNKKEYPNIILNGGGDLCAPTLNGVQILNSDVPLVNIPIYQYDSVFRNKDTIAKDRARFARAWFSYFNEWSDRGGGTPEEAFSAWFEMVRERYKKHVHRLKMNNHPKYIIDKLLTIDETMFGYSAFGLKDTTKFSTYEYLKSTKNKIKNYGFKTFQ